jgi:hypothetical protein
VNRLRSGSIPLRHPSFGRPARLAQWQCSSPVNFEEGSIPSPGTKCGALVQQLRRLPLKQENLGQHEGALPLAGCSRSGRALEAREVGAKPTPAANDLSPHRPSAKSLASQAGKSRAALDGAAIRRLWPNRQRRHAQIVFSPGSNPGSRTSSGIPTRQRKRFEKPSSAGSNPAPSTKARVAQSTGGTTFRPSAVWVPNPSARTNSLRSVPAEWSATSPENWDGYLIGRGFDSSALRQITVRLGGQHRRQGCRACLLSSAYPWGYSDHARGCPPRRRSSTAEQRAGIAPIAVRDRATAPNQVSVTCGERRMPAVTRLPSGAPFDSALLHQSWRV